TECTVRDEGDLRPQNWWCDGSISFYGLKHDCGAMALSRTLEMTGARKLPSGYYDVVFENSCARSIVSTLINALYGSALQQRNSFLTDSIGKKLFPQKMSLCDRPHVPGMAGSTWYDAEGIATADMDIIKDGEVCTYFLGTYYALKMGMEVTVQSPSAVRFTKDDGTDCRGLMRQVGKGILVTGFNGGNCNPITGDFSYGVEGFLFENGEKVHPVKEMNFTGNMLRLWSRLLLTGNDPKDWTRWQIPSLAFGKCEFSGL
ncbi:MAG: TldD/PmbA family protein, partial [Alistipes sp.]|nr:TldD/PmbA family protein [Candidatus Minthomonas equi]